MAGMLELQVGIAVWLLGVDMESFKKLVITEPRSEIVRNVQELQQVCLMLHEVVVSHDSELDRMVLNKRYGRRNFLVMLRSFAQVEA